MSHFSVSLIVWAKSQDGVRKPQFLKRRESRSGSNRGPSAYQPTALPLGHTGSHNAAPAGLLLKDTWVSGLLSVGMIFRSPQLGQDLMEPGLHGISRGTFRQLPFNGWSHRYSRHLPF